MNIRAQPPQQLIGLKRPITILAVQQYRHIGRNIFYLPLKGIQRNIHSMNKVPIGKFLVAANIDNQ